MTKKILEYNNFFPRSPVEMLQLWNFFLKKTFLYLSQVHHGHISNGHNSHQFASASASSAHHAHHRSNRMDVVGVSSRYPSSDGSSSAPTNGAVRKSSKSSSSSSAASAANSKHVNFSGNGEEKKREKFLTAKYGAHQVFDYLIALFQFRFGKSSVFSFRWRWFGRGSGLRCGCTSASRRYMGRWAEEFYIPPKKNYYFFPLQFCGFFH